MPTLHIEHAILDFKLWRAAYDRFAATREQAGVLAERIQQPIDDPSYVVIDLDFATRTAAADFRTFLQQRVWAIPEASPALVGTPSARILEPADPARC